MTTVYGGPPKRRSPLLEMDVYEQRTAIYKLWNNEHDALVATVLFKAKLAGQRMSRSTAVEIADTLATTDDAFEEYFPQTAEALRRIKAYEVEKATLWETMVELRRQRKLAKQARKRANNKRAKVAKAP